MHTLETLTNETVGVCIGKTVAMRDCSVTISDLRGNEATGYDFLIAVSPAKAAEISERGLEAFAGGVLHVLGRLLAMGSVKAQWTDEEQDRIRGWAAHHLESGWQEAMGMIEAASEADIMLDIATSKRGSR